MEREIKDDVKIGASVMPFQSIGRLRKMLLTLTILT